RDPVLKMFQTFSQNLLISYFFALFFFNAPSTTEIYTLSLHDALPISWARAAPSLWRTATSKSCTGLVDSSSLGAVMQFAPSSRSDRKSTRLNSSHSQISYAVFCLKKKKNNVNSH